MLITGKHAIFAADFDVGMNDNGRLLGLGLRSPWVRLSALSGPVVDRAICHLDALFPEHGNRRAL
jgi:xanthine dehydrogenase molybdopterin-binding subunit B